jgi:hypothetical protein
MKATEILKYPYYIRHAHRGHLGKPSSNHHRTDANRPQARLASTQALWSCRVSSTSKVLDPHNSHQLDRCTPPVRPVHRSDRPSAVCYAQDLWPMPLMTWSPRSSRLDLGFVAQPRNHSWLHLDVLDTMWPTLDPWKDLVMPRGGWIGWNKCSG